MEVSKSAWIVNSILTPLVLLYPFQNGKGMIYPFGVGYCPMLADRSFHNLYSGEKAIVPRQFIKTLITNATSGNKLCNVIITMQFNGLELSAIVKLAKAMVAVDGKVEKSELSVMALEMVKFGVNPDAGMDFWNLADALDFGHAIAVISAMNQEQKKYVTGYLATIMAADGKIADSEVTLWRLISTLANLPAMNIGEAITFWKNN